MLLLPVASRRAPRKATPAAEAGYTRHIDTTRLPDHRAACNVQKRVFSLIVNRLEKELIRTYTHFYLSPFASGESVTFAAELRLLAVNPTA